MKLIKYADLTIQSLLVILALVFLINSFWSSDVWMILVIQLFVGVYQMISGFTSIVFSWSDLPRKKVFHFAIAIVYLVSLAVMKNLPLNGRFLQLYLFVPPWILAIYYYVISFNIKFFKRKRSKFLPNLGF
jgi:hypothetical protein